MPDLNGAYYGPAIPPPKSYHRPGRGGGCCCNPFSCCCSCLCNCIWGCVFQILCTVLVIAGIIILALWLIFRPNKLKFYADNASLTQFNLSAPNNTLYYNLALNMSIRNPNKRIGIYYDSIQADAYYQGQRFSSQQLSPFYQPHKNTTDLQAHFTGRQLLMLSSDQVSNYNNDNSTGIYDIDVKLSMRIRLKFGWVKSPKVKPKIECDMLVPMNGVNGTAFQSKGCHLDWWF